MITTPLAAFVAGTVASLHCAGMCGPLACSVMPANRNQGDPSAVAAAYHAARLTAYAALGALAGGLGRFPLDLMPATVRAWLGWCSVGLFLGLALRWDRRWHLPFWSPFAGLRRITAKGNRTQAAVLAGFATPLLPCGPLYLLVPLAGLAGSAARGAILLAAFGMGTLPLLWLAQTRWERWQRRLSPAGLVRLRVTLAVAAALVAAWRLRGTLGWGGPANTFVCF